MKIKKIQIIGLVLCLIIMTLSVLILSKTKFFFLIFGLGALIGISPFVFSIIHESRVSNEKEKMFLEFIRNILESVSTGTPISKAIINSRTKPYGTLTNHIKKLANQISIGIPLNKALQTFARDIDNKTVSRTITLISEAERSGGEVEKILRSVVESVNIVDKVKKERAATISSLTLQGYIIFLVFIAIVLVLQFQIIPSLIGFIQEGGTTQSLSFTGILSMRSVEVGKENFANYFVYLLLVQGFFTGLTIGKLTEGRAKAGIKHSFILMLLAFLISAGANALFG
ncbi:MAG: type II secretion system F family protein [Candidatus Pacearchaeota archaeon]